MGGAPSSDASVRCGMPSPASVARSSWAREVRSSATTTRSGGALAAQALGFVQELADRAVEDLVASAGGRDHVQVDPAARHAAQDELAEAGTAPAEPRDQEAAPRGRKAPAHAGQQIGAILSGGEGERDLVTGRRRRVENAPELGGGADPKPVVGAVSALQLGLDQRALVRVVVGDHEQRRSGGGRHWRSCTQWYGAWPRTSNR